jgi:hypothetical protein
VRRRAHRLGAFTLLEIMAAVLVLGLVYSVLAEAAIRGLRSEGVSRRRVEASLIADRWLADLETQVAVGQIPTSGSEEEEVDEFHVAVNVQPYDPTPMLEAIAAIEKQRGVGRPAPTQRARPPGPQSTGAARQPGLRGAAAEGQEATEAPLPVDSVLAQPGVGEEGRLRRIDIRVTWLEGDREELVQRTTFAFDSSGLEGLFPEQGADGEDGAGGGGRGGLEGLEKGDAVSRMQEMLKGVKGKR